jgi:hypothetical protein
LLLSFRRVGGGGPQPGRALIAPCWVSSFYPAKSSSCSGSRLLAGAGPTRRPIPPLAIVLIRWQVAQTNSHFCSSARIAWALRHPARDKLKRLGNAGRWSKSMAAGGKVPPQSAHESRSLIRSMSLRTRAERTRGDCCCFRETRQLPQRSRHSCRYPRRAFLTRRVVGFPHTLQVPGIRTTRLIPAAPSPARRGPSLPAEAPR